MKGVTEGRNVHYVSDNGHRAAIINKVCDVEGEVDLSVFSQYGDLSLEPDTKYTVVYYALGKAYSEEMLPGTWHFIEPA